MRVFHTLTVLANVEKGLADTEAGATFSAPSMSMALLTIFVLALYVGAGTVAKIQPKMFTTFVSGSNVISGITLLGAIVLAGRSDYVLVRMLGGIAVALATMNVVGGLLITHQALENTKEET
ncbi:MAG: proton-translocating transhydrogenase family protein [Planctomycetales bacterium]|jgi:NAD(P) transhydrogenase subunit alpha|nr:proton-translocating transhydrogenase family protein [Planctomycetales bacterium]